MMKYKSFRAFVSKVKLLILKSVILLLTTISTISFSSQSILSGQEVSPVLEFPEVGLDDTAAYRDYKTRFFRDSNENTFQISIYQNSGRVVNIWADAANESLSFTVRDTAGKPAKLTWGSKIAEKSAAGRMRYVQYLLTAEAPAVKIGLFLLGSMRKERDFRYQQLHTLPFKSQPFIEAELIELLENIHRLPREQQQRHLTMLGATKIEELRSRLVPQVKVQKNESEALVLIEQTSFDGKNFLILELSVDPGNAVIHKLKNTVSIRSLHGQPINLRIKVGTDSPSLTQLSGNDIFNADFMKYYNRMKASSDSLLTKKSLNEAERERISRFKRLTRQVKSMELLSSEEKLMAGLPNFATYFGRDMIMSALMLEPVWSPAMLEHVLAGVLNKLSLSGEVSHEEGLGGQAIRENAALYNGLITEYLNNEPQKRMTRESWLHRAEKVLANLQAVKEDYRMLDDDFQLPVLAARYLSRADIDDDTKINFLQSESGHPSRLPRINLLLGNLNYVAKVSSAYVTDPVTGNLIAFPKRDEEHWFSGSWRDSNAGYANGRYAMDINAIWVPEALEAIAVILPILDEIGYGADSTLLKLPDGANSSLLKFVNNKQFLRQAIQTWKKAIVQFEITLSAEEVQRNIQDKLRSLPANEKIYWESVLANIPGNEEELTFLALSLDAEGNPIRVANTDPATWFFLEDFSNAILKGERTAEDFLKHFRIFVKPYPVGLFVEGLGPLVANDVYATPKIWNSFNKDRYHSPTTVWGREANLILLGLSKQILSPFKEELQIVNPALVAFHQQLKADLKKILAAVEASGLKYNELWSYKIVDGNLVPQRYLHTSDIQLWNLTDLSVQFLINKITRLSN